MTNIVYDLVRDRWLKVERQTGRVVAFVTTTDLIRGWPLVSWTRTDP